MVWVGFFLVVLYASFDLDLAEFLFSVCISMDGSSCFFHFFVFIYFICCDWVYELSLERTERLLELDTKYEVF